jgi:hypothetical protein
MARRNHRRALALAEGGPRAGPAIKVPFWAHGTFANTELSGLGHTPLISEDPASGADRVSRTSRAAVYCIFLDPEAVEPLRAPDGMTAEVHDATDGP